MSLKTVVQAVCDEVGLPRIDAVASGTGQLARQMLALANLELREISRARDWPALTAEYTFNTVAGQQAYALPSSFGHVLPGTVYDQTQYLELRGSVTPDEWQYRKNGLLSNLIGYAFRIVGSVVKLTPTPQGVDSLVLEYQTSMLAVSEHIDVPQYQLDGDVAKVDETLVQMGLKWRIKHAKGLDYSEDRAEYDRAIPRAYARETAPRPFTVGRDNFLTGSPLTSGYVRDTGFGP